MAVQPADEIGPYLRNSVAACDARCVEVIALRGRVEPSGIELTELIPVLLDGV